MNHTCHITSGPLTPRVGFIFISWINKTSLKSSAFAEPAPPEHRGEAFHLIPRSKSLCCVTHDEMPKHSPSILRFMGPDDR